MGYYTRFNLTVQIPKSLDVPASFVTGAVAEWIRKNEEASYALNCDDFSCRELAKWYACDDDLKAFSKVVRNIIFIMDCMGEDGQHWRIYAKSGEVERVTPTLVWKVPKFAESCPACEGKKTKPHKKCILR